MNTYLPDYPPERTRCSLRVKSARWRSSLPSRLAPGCGSSDRGVRIWSEWVRQMPCTVGTIGPKMTVVRTRCLRRRVTSAAAHRHWLEAEAVNGDSVGHLAVAAHLCR